MKTFKTFAEFSNLFFEATESVKSYKSDILRDFQVISSSDDKYFIWLIRETGTFLFELHERDSIKAVLKALSHESIYILHVDKFVDNDAIGYIQKINIKSVEKIYL